VAAKTDQDRFVEEHAGLVRHIANKLKAQLDLQSIDLDDMIAYGNHGLIEAQSRYDASRGVQFNTFAYYRIRGAILDGVRKFAYMPRRVYVMVKAAEAADMVAEGVGDMRAAAPGAAREDLEATAQTLDEAVSKITAAYVMSVVGQGPDDKPETPEERFTDAEERDRIDQVVAKLPEREQRIVRAFYFESRTMDDIAKELGISKSWVSRIHSKALEMLKEDLGG
jgi:RNA polymerase sigma factor FliA